MAIAAAIALLVANPALSQTSIPTTANMTVTAQIVTGCGVIGGGSGTGLSFGTINYGIQPATTRGAIDAVSVNSSLTIECSANQAISLSIDAGSHSSGDGQRNLAGPNGSLVPYRLYFDSGRTQPFTVGSAISTTVSGLVNLPIYGRATLSGGPFQPGTYTDVAQVTLTY